MTDFPDIRRGTQLSDTAARQWQNLMGAVHAVAGMQVGEGLEYTKAGEVMHLGLMPEIVQRRPATRIVVVVKRIDPFVPSMVLSVREVRYRDTPPKLPVEPINPDNPQTDELQYTWHEDVFPAFPDYGYRPIDYDPYYWDMEQDGVPDASAVFFKARFEHDIWIVDLVSGAMRPDKLVVVRAFGNDAEGQPSATSKFLFVQEVRRKYDTAHNWTGEWVLADPDEAPVEVNVWGNMKAGDFAPFLWLPTALNEFVTLMPLKFILGDWWVVQQFKQPVSVRRGPLQLVDCQPTEQPS